MNRRRDFLKTVAAGAALPPFAKAATMKKRPNILWIIAEDMNPWLSCYGTTLIRTPVLDGMAARGVQFNRAYVTAPVCSACRSALITGCMQTTLGVHNHRSSRINSPKPEEKELGLIYLPEGVKTIPEYFRDAGYVTFNQGKTDYNFVYDNGALYTFKRLEDALNQNKPWFEQVQIKGGKNGKVSLKGRKVVDPADVEVPPYYPDHPVYRGMIADHYECCLGTDVTVGQILEQVREAGQLDDTIIFFFSDHGMPGGLRHKQFCYEGGIHIPLIVRWPKNFQITRPGIKRDDLVSTIDVSVTTMALAGLPIPEHMEGRNLFATNYKPLEYVISARDRCDFTIDRIRCVTTRRFAYIRNFLTDRPYLQPQYRDDRDFTKVWKQLYAERKLTPEAARFVSPERPAEEFYDLENDPHQIRNLVDNPKYEKELNRHRKILEDWIRETDDKGQYPESPESLLQVMYRWGKRCVNPEYEAVRKKYGNIEAAPKKSGKARGKKRPKKKKKKA